MLELFEIAGGSVAGRQHLDQGENNQDHYDILQDKGIIVGIVSDGCGSCPHSEVGAYLGVRMLAAAICRRFMRQSAADTEQAFGALLEDARRELLGAFRSLAEKLNRDLTDELITSFLFTLLGVVLTERWAAIFSLGDGFIFVNGSATSLKADNNRPPYIGYGLTPMRVNMDPAFFTFRVHAFLPAESVDSILIATDGIEDLINAKDKRIPGKTDLVGDISAFWTDDRFFANPDAISRRLRLINKEHKKLDYQTVSANNQRGSAKELARPFIKTEKGLLHDDATLIVVRRMP
jgi:hypothetical protein